MRNRKIKGQRKMSKVSKVVTRCSARLAQNRATRMGDLLNKMVHVVQTANHESSTSIQRAAQIQTAYEGLDEMYRIHNNCRGVDYGNDFYRFKPDSMARLFRAGYFRIPSIIKGTANKSPSMVATLLASLKQYAVNYKKTENEKLYNAVLLFSQSSLPQTIWRIIVSYYL